MRKDDFAPGRQAEPRGNHRATRFGFYIHRATYQQCPTTGTQAKQAHTSVEAVGSEVSHNTLQETNGADHVNRRPSLIERPGSRDLKNEQPSSGHVIKTDGQD
jgi:hypothetical protein